LKHYRTTFYLLDNPNGKEAGYAPVADGTTAVIAGRYRTNSIDPRETYTIQQGATFPNAFRFEVHQGDEWPGDAGREPAKMRAELNTMASSPFDAPVWWAGSLRIPPGLDAFTKVPIVMQYHANDDDEDFPSAPLVAIELDYAQPGGGIKIAYAGGATNPTVEGDSVRVQVYTGPIEPDVFHDFVVMAHFTRGTATGKLKVWMNRSLIVDRENILIGYNDAIGPYHKFGVYCTDAPQVVVVEWAGIVDPTTDSLEHLTTRNLPHPI